MSRLEYASPQIEKPRAGLTLLIGMIVLVAVGKPILCDTMDPDCFWHLRVAEQLRSQLHSGKIGPIIDHLSFASMQEPWTPYSWLAELGMNSLWHTLGWRAAVAAHALMAGAFVTFIALACRARPTGGSEEHPIANFTTDPTVPDELPSAVATAAAAVLSLAYISFRPVTAALVLLALCGWILVRDRRSGERTRTLWCLVPLTVLIVNLHLYAIFIPLWIAALWFGAMWERRFAMPEDWIEAERRLARYGVLLGATIIACLATPMLPGVIGSILHYQAHDPMVASGEINEMRPFYSGIAGLVSAGIVLVIAACAIFNARKLRVGELLCFAGATALLFRLGRFAPPFAMIAAPIFAITMPKLSSRVLHKKPVCAVMAMVILAGIVRLGISFPRPGTTLDAWLVRQEPGVCGYPCAAADYVDAHVKPMTGKLINEFTWGGYLEWRFANRYQTLLDGRTQLFSAEFWHATYLGTDQDRSAYLAQLRADAAILPVHKSKFERALKQQGWQVAYQDSWATVLLPPPQPALDTQPKFPFATVFFGE